MKKFGTPTWAGPGVANDTVGFAAVGAPPGVRSTGWAGAGAFGAVGLACPPAPPPEEPVLLGSDSGLPVTDCVTLGPFVVCCREPSLLA